MLSVQNYLILSRDHSQIIMAKPRNLKFTDTIPCEIVSGGHFDVLGKNHTSKIFNYNKIVV